LSQYPRIVAEIIEAIQSHQDYTLLVHHATVLQWLKNMSQCYPQGAFVFETINARSALLQRWGMEIPDP
jgi:hypothetical protein